MANEKLYYPSINSTDRQILHEDGGGIVMTDQGKFMYSSLSQEKLEELKELQFNGNLPTDFNDVSIIGIMNQTSQPQNNIEEGSSNRTTLLDPTGTNPESPASNNICGGVEVDNTEFQEATKIFSLWEELNSNGGVTNMAFYDNNKYVKSTDQLNTLFITPDLQQIISKVGLNSAPFKNLGWGQYGSGQPSLLANVGFFYSDYWTKNLAPNNPLGKLNNQYQKQFKQTSNNQTLNKNIFDIQTLPSGLRTMCLRTNYNSGKIWVNRILTAIGPNYMNSGFGITIAESREGSGGLPFDDKVQRFFTQYDQIIALYNQDKQKFLEQLAKETKDFTVRLVDQGSDPRFKAQPAAFKDFYSIYIDLALAIAFKYKDCPNEFEVVGNVANQPKQTTKKPTNKVSNKNEIVSEDEGLYQIEFDALPTNEDEVVDDFKNTGVEDGGGVNDPNELIRSSKNVIDASNEKKTNLNLNVVTISFLSGKGTTGSTAAGSTAGGGSLYTIKKTGVVNDDVNNALISCKTGAKNALEVAVRMNPKGAGVIFNNSLPEWAYNDKNLILNAIVNKLACPQRFHCAAGISLSFMVFNQNTFKDKSSEAGGFPSSNSSHIVPTKEFTGQKVSFDKGTDWDPKNETLTQSGINKFNQAKNFKGGIFTIGTSGAGHIGMIWYIALEELKDKKGNVLGQRGYFYTLEFNTALKNQTTGGTLAFRKRLIGASWGARSGGDKHPVWFGDTSIYKGGNWAINGLGNDNSYLFGTSITYSKQITG